MEESEGVKKLKEQYFFGFGKFFSFSSEENSTRQKNACWENKISYFIPINMNCSPTFDTTCVCWSTIFHLCKSTGKVHAYGWFNGEKMGAMENILLPIPSKIQNLQADWEKVILICSEGKCHVISNLHGDWTTSVYENKTKFASADVGEMHVITVDENGKAFTATTDVIDSPKSSSKSSPLLFSPLQLKVRVDQVSCGKEHVLLLSKTTGHVFSFGLGTRGQLGHGMVDKETIPKLIDALTGVHLKQVAAGGWHSLALSSIGDIYAWGWNNHGQLGITCLPPEVPQAFYMLPYIVDFPLESSVSHVACGARHSGAVISEPRQSVLTWGWGKYGQLGHGDDHDRSRPTVVEYFENIDGQILDINCGPWQTIVTFERHNLANVVA